jgi:hypothetical protein
MSTERLFSPQASARGAPVRAEARDNAVERVVHARAGASLRYSPLNGG